jgi:alpha-N-arabinofuranosidase
MRRSAVVVALAGLVLTGCAATEREEAMNANAAMSHGVPKGTEPIRFEVLNKSLGKIDHRLFGQFMERPSWGETGVEAAVVPGTNNLQPEVLRLLEEMKIPIVRFPGGTDVDHMDWLDMIDNVPGREGGRRVSKGHKGHEVTNRFGYDEFLRLAEKMSWETIIVVNLRDGQLGLRPMKDAALHAAGLVAYCNASIGARLPEGMPDWPALRAKNGRQKPYGVKYVQLGNETWAWTAQMKERYGERQDEVYAESIMAYEEAIHAVDPSVKIIIDFRAEAICRIREKLGDRISYLCGHYYVPWGIRKIEKNGRPVTAASLTAEEIWHAFVSTPKIDDDGLAMLDSPLLAMAPRMGYKLAVTEWNFNGGWGHDVQGAAQDSSLARGLGAAGFLHAMMRRGGDIEIATQSMLVGKGWGITAVRVDEMGQTPAYMRPSGMVTMFYSQHHGDRRLEMKASGVPTYVQPLRLEGIRPSHKVAMIDAVTTATDRKVYWHAINRSFDRALPVTLDLTDLGPLTGQARMYVLEGRLDDERVPGPRPVSHIREEAVTPDGSLVTVTVPARCVVIVEAGRK